MPICFVIQPFDNGAFDARYADVFKPAIEAADLGAYRVDEDPKVEVPIDAIEEKIRSSAICLADITLDNPNVWYELGYARAAGRKIVMVCSEARQGKYPFDIQHRTVIRYAAGAPRDFEKLKTDITQRLKSYLEASEVLENLGNNDQVAPV